MAVHPQTAHPNDKNDLARSLIPLVHEVARQVSRRLPAHVMMEDLVGAGMLGLATALQRFDPARSETFKGYAEFRIRGAILDELRRRDTLTRDARAERRELERTLEELRASLGREPEDEELATRLGMDLDGLQAARMRLSAARLVPADLVELPEEGRADPADEAVMEQVRRRLAVAIRTLPRRMQTVLSLFYFHEAPLKEIAALLQVSPSRVCQIRGEAVARLRHHVHEDWRMAA